jgi:uncharacterized repeat protein (TIGR01451 family)
VAGTVQDNAGTPVMGAVATTTPGAFATLPSDSGGNYATYVNAEASEYSVSWEKDGYDSLPATDFDPAKDGEMITILPPADNLVLDWGFESGSLEPSWQTGGIITPVVTDDTRHTGHSAASLGCVPFAFGPRQNTSNRIRSSRLPKVATDADGSAHVVWHHGPSDSQEIYYMGPHVSELTAESTIAQAITSPLPLSTPGLSFVYQLSGISPDSGNSLRALIDDGSKVTTVFTSSKVTDGWVHRWFDLSPWAGQMITLTFALSQTAGYPSSWAYLDEVTLGSTYPDLWASKTSLTPVALPGEQVAFSLTYGNRGGAPANGVRITDTLPAELSFVTASPPPLTTTPMLVWDVGSLPAKSGAATIVVTATISPEAPMHCFATNAASIGIATPELETLNNDAQARVFIGHRIHLPVVLKE